MPALHSTTAAEQDQSALPHLRDLTLDLLQSCQGVNAYVVKAVESAEFMEALRHLGAFSAVLNEWAPAVARPSSTVDHG